MRIGLFGGSGRTGRAVLAAAARRDVAVRALARPGRPGPSLRPAHAIDVVTGDYDDEAALDRVVAGCDATLCVFGPLPPYREAFCRAATEAVIAALGRSGGRRLIVQTGAMIDPDPAIVAAPLRLLARVFAAQAGAVAADRVAQERAVRASALDWTIVKPPRLTDGPACGRVAVGPTVRIGLFAVVSRADLARVLLDLACGPRGFRERVYVRAVRGRRGSQAAAGPS